MDLQRFARFYPIRRLSPEECDAVGYEWPLVLSVRQIRWILGPWRSTKTYVVTHPRRGVMWSGSKKELLQLGLELD